MTTAFNVGHILYDNLLNKEVGVIAYKFPDKFIIFKVDNNIFPTFSKLPLEGDLSHIEDVGNINQFKYENLKTQLLKYYRTRQLSSTEQNLLRDLLKYSYPNGIPAYQTFKKQSEHSLEDLDIQNKLNQGSCLYLNTTKNSDFNHLNNKCVYVLKKDNDGVWVCDNTENGSNPIYTYLILKDKVNPSFYGISRVIPTNKVSKHFTTYLDQFKKMEQQKLLYSQIKPYNLSEYLKIEPSNNYKVVYPSKYKGNIYDYKVGRLATDKSSSRALNYDNIINIDTREHLTKPYEKLNIKQTNLQNLKNSENELDYGLILEKERNSEEYSNTMLENKKIFGKDYYVEKPISQKRNRNIVSTNNNELENFENVQYLPVSKTDSDVKNIESYIQMENNKGSNNIESEEVGLEELISNKNNDDYKLLMNIMEAKNSYNILDEGELYKKKVINPEKLILNNINPENNIFNNNNNNNFDSNQENIILEGLKPIEKKNIKKYIKEDEMKTQELYGGKSSVKSNLKLSKKDEEDLELRAILNKQVQQNDSQYNSSGSMSNSESEDEFNENNMDFIDMEDFEVVDENVEKVRVVEIRQEENEYSESIQQGHLMRFKINKLNQAFRNNPIFLNRIKKQVNIISLLKHNYTLEDNSVRIVKPNYKPLVDKYLNRDFNNQFLIPLTVSKKKIYLTKDDKLTREEFNEHDTLVNNDFGEYLTELQKNDGLDLNNRIKSINLDNELNKSLTEMNPQISYELDLFFELGQKINPNEKHHRDGKIKTNYEIGLERINKISQNTMTIRYGENPYQIENYSIKKNKFDVQVNIGPMARFLSPKSDEERRNMNIEDLEALQKNVDYNIDTNSNDYKIYYPGDTISVIGFVRPPLNNNFKVVNNPNKKPKKTVNEGGRSLMEDLNRQDNNNNIVIKYLNRLDKNKDESNELDISLDYPDKYIIYMLPNNTDTQYINDNVLEQYFTNVIPKVEDIVGLYEQNYKLNSEKDMSRLIKLLYNFNYVYSDESFFKTFGSLFNINSNYYDTDFKQKITYKDYEFIRKFENQSIKNLVNHITKLDSLSKLKTKKTQSDSEKSELKEELHTFVNEVVSNDTIELCDKIYSMPYVEATGGKNNLLNRLDTTRLEYYSSQVDNSKYLNLLLFKRTLTELKNELDIDKLENTLKLLEEKLANLENKQLDLSNPAQQKCNDKPTVTGPKVINYNSLEEIEKTNGIKITDAIGEPIKGGDYALVKDGNNEYIYKREELAQGDFWIAQPNTEIENILKLKQTQCEQKPSMIDMSKQDKDKMLLPEETNKHKELGPDEKKALCLYDLSKLQCNASLGGVDGNEYQKQELRQRINELRENIDFSNNNLPSLLGMLEKSVKETEKLIRDSNTSKKELENYMLEQYELLIKETEKFIKRKTDCPHFMTIDWLESKRNLTDEIKYNHINMILNRFMDSEHAEELNLFEVERDNDSNNLKCHVCEQSLMCKHNLYAINFLSKSDNYEILLENLKLIYGVEVDHTITCRVCGEFIDTTDVQDIEDFGKGENGARMQTREVVDDINLVEKQKNAIQDMINEAIYSDENDSEDKKFKFGIYKDLKDLCGRIRFSIEDELDMTNFIQTHPFKSKKKFFDLLRYTYLKAGKKIESTTVLDKLATETYNKNVFIDICIRFLIMLQASKNNYNITNPFCVNNYIGYPLINDNTMERDMTGIEFIMCLIKQLSIVDKYDYLIKGASGLAGVRKNLITRLDEILDNNEIIRTKLELGLDYKFNEINNQEEKLINPTNFWLSFKPTMTFGSSEAWSPSHDLTKNMLNEWNSSNYIKLINSGKSNIEYHTHLLRNNIYNIYLRAESLNNAFRLSSVRNSAIPFDLNKLSSSDDLNVNDNELVMDDKYSSSSKQSGGSEEGETEKTTKEYMFNVVGGANSSKKSSKASEYIRKKLKENDKFLNPEIKYYDQVIKYNSYIRNNLNKIKEYQKLYNDLIFKFKTPRVKISYPGNFFLLESIKFNMNISDDTLNKVFKTYVNNGLKVGHKYIFNSYGRCLISNTVKEDLEQITFTKDDFNKLLKKIVKLNVIEDKTTIKYFIENNLPNELVSRIALDLNNYETSGLLLKIIIYIHNIYNNNKLMNSKTVSNTVKELLILNFEKIVIESSNNTKFYKQLNVINEEIELCQRLFNHYNKLNNVIKTKNNLFYVLDRVYNILMIKVLDVLSNTPSFKLNIKVDGKQMGDSNKIYFSLINELSETIQNNVSNVVEKINSNKKDEIEDEKSLIDIGIFLELEKDYQEELNEREKIQPYYEDLNKTEELQNFKFNSQFKFIQKMINDIKNINNILANEAWTVYKTDADIKKYHLEQFYKYKNNNKLFGKFSNIINETSNICNELYFNNNNVFTVMLNKSLAHYLLLLIFNNMISIVNSDTKSQKTLKQTRIGGDKEEDLEPNEFNFGKIIDDANKQKQKEMYGGAVEKLNKDLDIDTELYPELLDEDDKLSDNELDEDEMTMYEKERKDINEQFAYEDDVEIHYKLEATKSSNKQITFKFIKDLINYMSSINNLYNELNHTNMKKEKAEYLEKETRLNLKPFKEFAENEALADEAYIIYQMMRSGNLNFSQVGDYYNTNFNMSADTQEQGMLEDEDFDVNAYDDEDALDGNGFKKFEREEMGLVAGTAEDAEDILDQDYGYLAVDEG
jgi:hypothetical protein